MSSARTPKTIARPSQGKNDGRKRVRQPVPDSRVRVGVGRQRPSRSNRRVTL